ncbi:hypothetical protein LBMAG14_10470 [Actinomycetes bacterium]|nr:hypothetical protein LBMAG14_10470 [Actinomycetes bacterium]
MIDREHSLPPFGRYDETEREEDDPTYQEGNRARKTAVRNDKGVGVNATNEHDEQPYAHRGSANLD